MSVSAYIPVYNQPATVVRAVESLLDQAIPITRLLVVDDGSTEPVSKLLPSHPLLTVIRFEDNRGRGEARAFAMDELDTEFILNCDATNALPPDFLKRALSWMSDPDVASVYGRIRQGTCETIADRWRAAHLFKERSRLEVRKGAGLITYGTLVRRSAVMEVGNCNRSLIHSEDEDLGKRLARAGYVNVFDPELPVLSLSRNTPGQVMERYWRWYAGPDEKVSLAGYFQQIRHSITNMLRLDLQDRDLMRIPISLLCPHYQFWRSLLRPVNRR